MYKIYVFIAIVFYLPLYSSAQISNVVFIGSVSVQGGATYPYKLFVTDSNDVLYGHSITDIAGFNETKTSVRGAINSAKKLLTFREKAIIYTRTKGEVDFCFIHARLKAGKIQGASTLRGNFTGYREDGKTECAKGKIMLVCAEDVLGKLMEYAEKHDIMRSKDTIVAPPAKVVTVQETPIDEATVTKLLPGRFIELPVTAGVVTIDLWDAKDVDGDIITLMQDSNVLLDKYALKGTHKVLSLNMDDKKKISLRLIAENEGARPINTTRIRVRTPNETYIIDASTTIGKDVTIIIDDIGKN